MFDKDSAAKVYADAMRVPPPIDRAVVLDYANYYGLLTGRQVMFCTRIPPNAAPILLRRKLDSHNKKYPYSITGERFVNDCINNKDIHGLDNEFTFIAEIALHWPPQDNLAFCEALAEKFPYWKPKEGTYEYINKPDARIAVCRVYRISRIEIDSSDISGRRAIRTVTSKGVIEELNLKASNKVAVLPDNLYNIKRDKILKIINDHSAL